MKISQNESLVEYLPTVHQLETFTTKELKQLFDFLHPSDCLSKYTRSFLLGNLAWIIQIISSGSDHKLSRDRLIKIVHQHKNNKVQYLPGTRLIREWRGTTHEVIIENKGFRWKRKHYRSLSHIAREITGTNWSGPRFFGIKP